MTQKIWALMASGLILLSTSSGAFASSDIELSGDILRALIPAGALSYAYRHDDTDGMRQFVKSFLGSSATVYGLKNLVEKERPDGGDHSFPSGHAAMAFSGATFLQRRYGWKIGLTAYACAGYVGWTRLYAEEHDFLDVAVGSVIGSAGAFCFTTKHLKTVQLVPGLHRGSGGFRIDAQW
jgi:membrane-associated phospholipid phosphatase